MLQLAYVLSCVPYETRYSPKNLFFRENDPFALFMFGCDVYAGRHDKSEIEDRLHFFTEECDHLQVS